MDLRSGNGIDGTQKSPPNGVAVRRLEEVFLTASRIEEIFGLFFRFYHPFLPFLNPERLPDEFFQRSPLLFWTIIAVGARHYKLDRIHTALAGPVMRLTWQTLAEVPQNYHVVKALCLLCTWPFSTSSTSTDPTFMLCGAMMHIALQIGLHRPSHSQDFTKFKLDLREAEVADRVRTWATCNIVAQRVATAYGQPVNTIYDWTLSDEAAKQYENHVLPPGIYNRLQIEMFVDKVSKTLYINHHDSVGIGADHERSTYVSFLTEDYNRLKQKIASDNTPVTQLYLRAAYLHLRLCVFFSPPDLPSYQSDLLELYNATTSFLELCLSLDSQAGVTMPSSWNTGLQIIYGSNYIFQMMLAAGFSLLKLNYTFLRHHSLDTEGASQLFTRTTWALRSMSVAENDLAERLAEVLAQVWRTNRGRAEPDHNNVGETTADDSLQLKVKCRMSMSHVFDSVWRWRQNFQFKGKSFECKSSAISANHVCCCDKPKRLSTIENISDRPSTDEPILAYLKNPTDPAAPSANDSSASSTIGGPSASNNTANTANTDPSIATEVVPGMAGMPTGMGMGSSGNSNDYNDPTMVGAFTNSNASYEVFDPLNWMLDGLVDFPYDYNAIHGLQSQGLG